MPSDKTVITVISDDLEARPVPTQACLVVIYGEKIGRKYDLTEKAITIGRSSKADIIVDQESVSREHAEVSNQEETVVIVDQGSTNGTYVNDKLITEHILQDGDFIKIGRTMFKFLSGGNIEQSYHEEIYMLTTMDGLTQVYNKRYFMESLNREISRADRYKRALSLIMLDIDHFKKVNDTFGHLAGDAVLKQLASVIKERIRCEDIVARYGGEEFSIIMPELSSENATVFADRLREMVENSSFQFDDAAIPVTVSIGIATMIGELIESQELISIADEKLYQAKRSGRNRVCS